MSYILEALKKSQQQRDLGQVPRLEESWLEQLPEAAHPHPWMLGSAVVALLALVVALYALMRDGGGEPQPIQSSAADPKPVASSAEILVVPAPDPSGRPLPRGAEEIRRAVLGEPPSPEPMSAPDAAPSGSVIPPTLIADIEAFKHDVKGRGERAPPPKPEPAPPRPVEARPAIPSPSASTAQPALPEGPPPDLRQALPDYAITVHVYNADPAKRLVYVNGHKMREQDSTPEGVKVEEITSAGAILSFQGTRFFARR